MPKNTLGKHLILWSLFILFFFFFIGVFFLVEPYIHETGHIIFGSADGLLKGNLNTFTITYWNNHPLFGFIKTPQQVKITHGTGSPNFVLGGPLFSMLIFFGLSLFGYSLSKEKKWFLIFLSIATFELSGNVICGTDNLIGGPLSFCNKSLDLKLQLLAFFIFSGIWSYLCIKRLKYAKFLQQS